MEQKKEEELKTLRGNYLQAVIEKYLNTEPKLSYEEIAFLILEFQDSDKFIKALKKEAKAKY